MKDRHFLFVYQQTWLVRYREASTAIQNRHELVADAAELIERNLILLGATGIEDKLQDVSFHEENKTIVIEMF